MQLLETHYAEKGQPPLRNSASEAERQLGRKLNFFRVKFKKGALPSEQVSLLDSRVPLWKERANSDLFLTRRIQNSVHRLGAEEARRSWRATWYTSSSSAKAIIEQHFGPFLAQEEIDELHTQKSADELIRWVRDNKRFPGYSSAGNPSPDAEERRLAGALLRFRTNITSTAVERVIPLLDSDIPGWRDTRRSSMVAKAEEYALFYEKNGRLITASDSESAQLGTWLMNIRRAKRLGNANPEAVKILDARVPGWDITKARNVSPVSGGRSLARAEAVVSVVSATGGKYPRAGMVRTKADGSVNSRHPIETAMGLFLSGMRGRHYATHAEAERVLDLGAPLWRISRDYGGSQKPNISNDDYADGSLASLLENTSHLWTDSRSANNPWHEKLAEYLSFCSEAGAHPKGNPDNPAESALYRWMNNQKQSFRAGTLPTDREETLNKSVPGWSERKRQREVTSG